jgi:hypothetical protein
MRILYETRVLLNSASFVTDQPAYMEDSLQFEDANIVGLVVEFPDVEYLLNDWEERQHSFLKQNAARWRIDPLKAWNIYMVFLTTPSPVGEEGSRLLAIEEDFTATRKIARAGIGSKTELARALAPILPLSTVPATEHSEPEDLLKRKLDADERILFELIMNEATSDSEIISWLLERAQ